MTKSAIMTEPEHQRSGTGGNHKWLYVSLKIQKYFNGPPSRSNWSNPIAFRWGFVRPSWRNSQDPPMLSKLGYLVTHKIVTHALTCMCIHNVIKIYHAVQELWAFSLTAIGWKDELTSDKSAHLWVVQSETYVSVHHYFTGIVNCSFRNDDTFS